jgi:hypothetical protein
MAASDGCVDIALDDAERKLLVLALNEFGGPATQSFEVLPPLVGACSYGECSAYVSALMESIDRNEPQSNLSWARALFLTEVSFGSSLVASGRRFGPRADEYWILVLRSLQDKASTEERYRLLRDNTAFPTANQVENGHGSRAVSTELVDIDLDEKQRKLIAVTLNEYARSPWRAYPLLAPMVGKPLFDEWVEYCRLLKEAVSNKNSLTDLDWARALFLTDMGFTSDLIGFAKEFRGADKEGITVLRSIQDTTSTLDRYLLLSENAAYPWYARDDDDQL